MQYPCVPFWPQILAKERGIKANLAKVELIEQLAYKVCTAYLYMENDEQMTNMQRQMCICEI